MRSALFAVLLALPLPAAAGESASVFEMPRVYARCVKMLQDAGAAFERKDYAAAEDLYKKVVEADPQFGEAYYNLACAQARQNKKQAALSNLERAVTDEAVDAEKLKSDEDMASLRNDERFQELVKRAETTVSNKASRGRPRAVIVDGVATVTEENTYWSNGLGALGVRFDPDTAPLATVPIIRGFDRAGDLLRKWQAEGTAAGNRGDLYDNHDSDHSNMDYAAFPQLSRIEFCDAAKAKHLHHGLQVHFLYNCPTIGNSSTALVSGPFWRSQPRAALTTPSAAAMLYWQYGSNHLYVYPEHRDYDPGHNGENGKGHGDVFPANTPYTIVSQGSSGSDRPFLHAAAATLAAFRPEVKKALVESRSLMPTVQMVFRMSNKQVASPDDYLTGKAHPPVFQGEQIDLEKMVTLAHSMTADVLPPVAELQVLEEDKPVLGRDYFDVAPREHLIDTPAAMARVVKGSAYMRRMVVSAAPSRDPRKKPLAYHWVVLRGDAERIKINRRNADGSEVELLVPYHQRRPILPGSEMESNRVDIGLFVHNGTYYSAPAFVCLQYLDNEKREYDAQQRIASIDYTDPVASKNYVDPAIDFRKDWRDDYHYDPAGKLLGWTRRRGQAVQEFTADGRLVTKAEPGQPVETRAVRYVPQIRPNEAPILVQE